MQVGVVLLAAGKGSRFGGGLPKQYVRVAGKALLLHALDSLAREPRITIVQPVIAEGDPYFAAVVAGRSFPFTLLPPATGGSARELSMRNGLFALPETVEIVAVHDAARPLPSPGLLADVLDTAERFGAAAPAIEIPDTIKRIDADGRVLETPDRRCLRAVQTPQAARRDWLVAAVEREAERLERYTDDASLLEAAGFPVYLSRGEIGNRKITFAEDMDWLRARLRKRASSEDQAERGKAMAGEMRVGQGFDVHAFAEGRKLILGGIEIPHAQGLAGHSDADALIHAVCDALLGAAGLGDIGRHFPDTDARYADADSKVLLAEVLRMVRERGWRVVNVDATIVAQAPRLAPFIDDMRGCLAGVLELESDAVSIKATTTEHLGFAGRKEGIAVSAVALLCR